MHIHLISFNVPLPANYGGVIDVFYQIKSLKESNISVTLHCFEYGREHQVELEKWCDKVIYYPRNTSIFKQFQLTPYITASRNHPSLIENLIVDNDPIIFEGIHCCMLIDDSRLANRNKLVRVQNIEHDYYNSLSAVENNIIKKFYFKIEARKLKRFQKKLRFANTLLTISPNDTAYFSMIHKHVVYLPPFHPHSEVLSKIGKSDYCLYHGNLSVAENNEAALFLVNKVFNSLNIPLIIAGHSPSNELRFEISKKANISLVENASDQDMMKLIENAHVNILPTFQSTGIKLKLIAALYLGRFCLVNRPMVENTGLESLCTIAEDTTTMKNNLEKLMNEMFTEEMIIERKKLLQDLYNNNKNIDLLVQLLK